MKEINLAFKNVLRNKIDYLFLFWQLYYFAGVSVFVNTDESLLINLLLCIVFLFYKKKNIDIKLFFILVAMVIVNIVSAVYTEFFDFVLLSGFGIRLTIAYLIIRAYGLKFIDYFENIVFLLAVISIPFFIIQISYPEFFDIFKPISFLTPSREYAGHVNLFIYNLCAWHGVSFRNSGFMWEPSAFGAVLAWAMIINIYRSNYTINFRVVIFSIVMFTTFSLGAYVYLLIFIFAYLLERKLKKALIVYSFILTTLFFISNLTFIDDQFLFMTKKYEFYAAISTVDQGKLATLTNVARTQGFLLDINYFLEWPLGYGWYRNNADLVNMAGSPNGFGRFIIIWGIAGLVFLILSYKKYLQSLSIYYKSKIKYNVLYLIIFLLTLNGNPIDQKPMFLAFVLSGFILYEIAIRERKNLSSEV